MLQELAPRFGYEQSVPEFKVWQNEYFGKRKCKTSFSTQVLAIIPPIAVYFVKIRTS